MKSPSKPARTAKAPRTPRKTRTKASAHRPAQHSSGAPVEAHANYRSRCERASGYGARLSPGLGDCILVRVKRPDYDLS
jgi:hypothetical protein